MYVIHLIVDGGGLETAHRKSDVFLPMASIPEIKAWARRQCYVLGEPKMSVPTYEVKHTDGSNLTKEEYANLQPEDSHTTYLKIQIESGVKKPTPLMDNTIIDSLRKILNK